MLLRDLFGKSIEFRVGTSDIDASNEDGENNDSNTDGNTVRRDPRPNGLREKIFSEGDQG